MLLESGLLCGSTEYRSVCLACFVLLVVRREKRVEREGDGEGEKDLRGTLVSKETLDALTDMEMLRPATGIS